MVGFLDSLLVLTPTGAYSPSHDTTTIDSLRKIPGPDLLLRLFLEDMEQQYLKNTLRPRKELVTLIFNLPALHPEITPLDSGILSPWYIPEESVTKDTLNLWLTDTLLIHRERFDLAVNYEVKDSLGNPMRITDTVTFRVKVSKKGRKSKKKEKSKPALLIASNASGGRMNLNSHLYLETSAPVKNADTSRMRFYRYEDTLRFRQPYTLEKDSFFLRRFMIRCPWKENTQYSFELLPGSFTDIYGNTPDTTLIKFHTRKMEDYGNFKLDLENINEQTIIQLWDASEKKKIRQFIVSSDTSVYFGYLNPGKYLVKAIADLNKNKKWDTGIFLEKVQPEPVAYFRKEISIKANWDVEETWAVTYDFKPRLSKKNKRR